MRQRVKAFVQKFRPDRTYPDSVCVTGPNTATLEFFQTTTCTTVAEFGAYLGHTSIPLAEMLRERGGTLHVFDFDHRVAEILKLATSKGLTNIVGYPNSSKLFDSYNWSLIEVLRNGTRFDYVFLDGAHTWAVDGFTTLLSDRILDVGGFLDFDDYGWSVAKSWSMRPSRFPESLKWFTPEQIEAKQVQLMVDLLMRTDPRYKEVVPNKVFQKLRA